MFPKGILDLRIYLGERKVDLRIYLGIIHVKFVSHNIKRDPIAIGSQNRLSALSGDFASRIVDLRIYLGVIHLNSSVTFFKATDEIDFLLFQVISQVAISIRSFHSKADPEHTDFFPGALACFTGDKRSFEEASGKHNSTRGTFNPFKTYKEVIFSYDIVRT